MRRLHRSNHQPTQLNGFSLFELMIVLAIIVMVAVLVTPSLMERVRSGRVQEAADAVRDVVAEARRFAIMTGVDYHVRFEVNGQAVVAIPADPKATLVNSSGPDLQQSRVIVKEVILGDTLFLRAARDADPGGEKLKIPDFQPLDDAEDLSRRVWSYPILFRFDGTSRTKTFRVMDGENRTAEVSIRGLTGAVRVSPVFIMEPD